ncbi:hypothetical protein A2U01_0086655, partial [Trifolium medium]|nr:hypothetical protein [Trifolium medium]
HEHLGTIDDRHVARHCKAKKPEPAPQAPEHPTTSHGAPAIDPTLQRWFYHTWDQNTSNHRAMIVMQESMYNMQLNQQ